jgi:hypothetical protein
VNATVGFEKLAVQTGKPAMDNLAAILGVICKRQGVYIQARSVAVA